MRALIAALALLAVSGLAPSRGRAAPLHEAAMRGDAERAIRLLQDGAPVDALNERSQTPLHVAVGQPRARDEAQLLVAAALLDRGADPDGAPRSPERPLHVAAARGSAELVRLLLQRGAQADVPDANGMTPLMWASAVEGGEEIVELLLACGARRGSLNKNRQSALALARANGRRRSAERLMARAPR